MNEIWTPEATATKRQTVNLPPEYMQMLAVLAETSGDINLGLHCSVCHENVVGMNGHSDTRWIMECACRTFVGKNPTRSH